MDTGLLRQVLPHYVVMFLLAIGSLLVVESAVGNVGLIVEFAVILVVLFAYRTAALRFGFAPEVWKRS